MAQPNKQISATFNCSSAFSSPLYSNSLSRFSKNKNQLIVISPTSSLSARLRLISLFAQLASVVFSLPRSVEILLSSSSRLSSCARGLSLPRVVRSFRSFPTVSCRSLWSNNNKCCWASEWQRTYRFRSLREKNLKCNFSISLGALLCWRSVKCFVRRVYVLMHSNGNDDDDDVTHIDIANKFFTWSIVFRKGNRQSTIDSLCWNV